MSNQNTDRGKFAHTFAKSDDKEKTGLATLSCVALSKFLCLAPPTRPRNESKEDKKQRKTAVKQGKQARRTERKTMKQQFGIELKEQQRILGNRVQGVKKL